MNLGGHMRSLSHRSDQESQESFMRKQPHMLDDVNKTTTKSLSTNVFLIEDQFSSYNIDKKANHDGDLITFPGDETSSSKINYRS